MFKKRLMKALQVIVDIIEIYIPSISFIIMFSAFILQIFFRYFLNNPLTWPYEITVFGFMWTALFGALYAKRKGGHVKFTLVYDHLNPLKQLIMRLVGNSLICISFIIGFYPAYDYIMYLEYQKSTVLFIPYHIVYFPFLIFLLGTIIRLIIDIVEDISILKDPSRHNEVVKR